MKKFLYLLFIILVCSCNESNKSGNSLSDFIPSNADVVFKINDLETFKTDVENNELHAKLRANNAYTSLDGFLVHLDALHTEEDLLLCVEKEQDSTYFTLITRLTDSLFNHQELDSSKVLHRVIDSIFIASNSKVVLDNIQPFDNASIETTLETMDSDKSFSVLLNNEASKTFGHALLESDSLTFSSQLFLDIDISPERVLLNGITKASDSLAELANLFINLKAQENTIQNIVPSNADGYMSFTYNDFQILNSNLETYGYKEVDSLFNPELFQTINEVGQIFYDDSDLIVIRSIDPTQTIEALRNHQNVQSTFRSVDLVEFSENDL
ncbi:MAG: hypothetical protein KJO77_11790, partial [Bacteroidia bacterium]|nr:hypothetical protein [Bacteroidia bacterium]